MRIPIMVGIIVVLTSTLFAADTICFQGMIKDSDGVPVANDSYNMRFTLFNVETDGTQLWQEEHTAGNKVAIIQGHYAVELGSVTVFGSEFLSMTIIPS